MYLLSSPLVLLCIDCEGSSPSVVVVSDSTSVLV